MPSPTPIALIGSGIFAKEEHLPAILAARDTLSLVAIYSRSLASAQSLAAAAATDLPELELYSDDGQEGRTYEDLLKRDDVQGVVIALPIPVQPAYIRKALSAGKHVLAEKPVAKDVATARALLAWYREHIPSSTPSFGIAENFRFFSTFAYAARQIPSLGRLLGFRVRMQALVQPGGKYFETAWRKKPEYQGGFLLDGGVHFVAGTRMVLEGAGVRPVRTSAFSVQLQEHLPPVDTVDATVKLSNGATGTVCMSFGTTFTGFAEYAFACEKGTLVVSRGKVIITREGKEEVKEFPDEGNGVKQEIEVWGEGLAAGKLDPRQSPEEALKDLQVLEGMLTSGDNDGAPVELSL